MKVRQVALGIESNPELSVIVVSGFLTAWGFYDVVGAIQIPLVTWPRSLGECLFSTSLSPWLVVVVSADKTEITSNRMVTATVYKLKRPRMCPCCEQVIFAISMPYLKLCTCACVETIYNVPLLLFIGHCWLIKPIIFPLTTSVGEAQSEIKMRPWDWQRSLI